MMLLEEVAIEFPTCKIIVAHPSCRWQDEAISLPCTSPTSDRSLGLEPEVLPPQLVQYANSAQGGGGGTGSSFGSEFADHAPDSWIKDFEEAGFKDAGHAAIQSRTRCA